jgi:hypothetical protein
MGLGTLLLLLGAGCATTSHDERRWLLEHASAEVTYDLPLKQVMDAARDVLDEQGYLLAPGGSPNSFRTQWKLVGDIDTLTRWSKVLVVCQPRADGRLVLRAQQVTWVTPGRTASHPGMASAGAGKRGSDAATNYVPGEPYSPAKPVFTRALDLEWAIVQHLDPQFAAEAEQQVDLYLASNPSSGTRTRSSADRTRPARASSPSAQPPPDEGAHQAALP